MTLFVIQSPGAHSEQMTGNNETGHRVISDSPGLSLDFVMVLIFVIGYGLLVAFARRSDYRSSWYEYRH